MSTVASLSATLSMRPNSSPMDGCRPTMLPVPVLPGDLLAQGGDPRSHPPGSGRCPGPAPVPVAQRGRAQQHVSPPVGSDADGGLEIDDGANPTAGSRPGCPGGRPPRRTDRTPECRPSSQRLRPRISSAAGFMDMMRRSGSRASTPSFRVVMMDRMLPSWTWDSNRAMEISAPCRFSSAMNHHLLHSTFSLQRYCCTPHHSPNSPSRPVLLIHT